MKLTLKQWVAIGLIALVFVIALVFAATAQSGFTWGIFAAIGVGCVSGVLFVLFGKKHDDPTE